MLAIQELEPYIKEYPWKMKAARSAKGLTQKELAECAGVPLSAVTKMNINNQDALFNCAALCRILGVSMDELFGLAPALDAAELDAQNRELELERVRQAGELKRLEQVNALLSAQLENRRPIIYALMAVCALLLVAVIGYMAWDAQLDSAGLFRSAGLSVLAVFLAVLVIAAVCIMVYALRSVRK